MAALVATGNSQTASIASSTKVADRNAAHDRNTSSA
jgi:hypothetical protein